MSASLVRRAIDMRLSYRDTAQVIGNGLLAGFAMAGGVCLYERYFGEAQTEPIGPLAITMFIVMTAVGFYKLFRRHRLNNGVNHQQPRS